MMHSVKLHVKDSVSGKDVPLEGITGAIAMSVAVTAMPNLTISTMPNLVVSTLPSVTVGSMPALSVGVTSLPAGVVWDIRRDALPEIVAYVASYTPNLTSTLKKRMILTGACVVNVPTVGVQDRDFVEILFEQGGGGTLDLTAFVWPSTYTPSTISATVGRTFLFVAQYDATHNVWHVVSAVPYDS